MSMKSICFGVCVTLALPLTAAVDTPAVFTIGQAVVQSNPPGFGANYDMVQRANTWVYNPGMEPLTIYQYWELTGGGSDSTGVYALCNTRYYDTLSSGFLDGGHYRLYREVTDASGGRIEKIREGTIPTGGFVAAGYENINQGAIRAFVPATDAVDNYRIANGQTYYYAVRARDVSNNWSDYSAPIAGVSPHSLSNDDPRILTSQIPNPVLGQTYSSASPLVTMSAAGGTAPLSWSITAGSLPPNLVLLANGQITGVCPASVDSTVTIRVQDAASRTHTRQFRIFGSNPPSVPGSPQPPTNVQAAAFNGYVHLWWDPSPSADVVEYRVYRSRFPYSEHRECIYLGSGGPSAQSNDLLFIEKECLHTPPPETVSSRVIGLQEWGTKWKLTGSSATQETVAIPTPIPAQMQAENCGTGCVRITCAANQEFGIYQFAYAGTNDTWWGAGQLPTSRTYRIECWVRGEGLTLGHTNIRFRLPQYFDRRVTGIVNGAWTKLSAQFTVTNWIYSAIAVSGPNFLFTGPGTVYVDNAMVYDITAGEQAGAAHSSILRLFTHYTGASNLAHKGQLRYRYMEDPFEHVVRPAVLSRRRWDNDYGATFCEPLHLHDMLQAAYDTGDSPATRVIPWITANLHWTEDDFVKLVEFLAAPSTVGYGAVRAAQRGSATPWANEFRAICIEMGNEPWNMPLFFGFRGGFSDVSGRTYGRWCQYIWDYVATNTLYWTNSIKLVLAGWSSGAAANAFSGQARLACPRASHVSFTTYLGGWEAGQGGQIGGTTWSDDGLQQWTTFLDHSGKKWADRITGLQSAMAQSGMPFEIVVYEGGPSYLMSGLNGVELTPAEQDISRNYGRSLAAAIGTLDFWLHATLRGTKEQAFYGLQEDRNLWASHTYVFHNYRPHPSWQGLGLVNTSRRAGDMLVTLPESLPSCDLLQTNGAVLVTNATMAAVYAFKQSNTYTVVALNKKIDGTHNGVDFGDGATPLALRLPFSNPSKITLYKLSGDPRHNNRQQMNVNVLSQDISLAYFSATNFIVDQFTGGVSGGLPTGAVFMYVFEDVTPDPLPGAPQVTINQAWNQADPHDGNANPVIYFTVLFDRPVSGFTNGAASITLSGSAQPQTAVITPETGGGGALYSVAVSGMQRGGLVRASVPAGAAVSAADGTPCDASTSRDNVVTNLFTNDLVLAQWEFMDDPGTNFYQNPAATLQYWALAPVSLSTGIGVLASNNRSYNDDAFGCTRLHSAAQDWNDYLAWTLAPTSGWAVTIKSIRFGAFVQRSGDDMFLDLRWSTNNFATSVPLALSTNIVYGAGLSKTAGTAVDADTSGIAALSNCPHAVQFRLYLWGVSNQFDGAGIGKLGSAVPDLVIKGDMSPRAPYIVDHPFGTQVQLGTPASFSVEADGVTPLFYQWYHDGAPVANATAAVFQISNVQLSHTGLYYAVVSNVYGYAASRTAELSIIPEPAVLAGALLIVLALKRG